MIDLAGFCVFAAGPLAGGEVHVRPMQATDEPVFRDLYAEMRATELRQVPWSDDVRRAFCDSQYGLQDQHYRAHYVQFLPLAVCRIDEVAGRLYLGEFDDALILMDIIVAARHRRRGIGTALIETVTAFADRCGVEARLHVEPLNPVKAHYARLGFREVGEAGIYQQMVRPVRSGPTSSAGQA